MTCSLAVAVESHLTENTRAEEVRVCVCVCARERESKREREKTFGETREEL